MDKIKTWPESFRADHIKTGSGGDDDYTRKFLGI